MPVSAYSGPSATDLRPDIDNAWQFLCWWYEFCREGLIEIGWTVPFTGQLTAFRRFDWGDMSVLKVIAEENAIPGQNMYVRMGMVSPASMVGRTRDVDIVCVPGVWADLDTAEQVARARLVQSVVRANGWTQTGSVPHPRFQMFLRCEEGIVGADFIRSLNRRMLRLYGGDPAVVNPGRLMRVAGTIAWPYKAGRVPELTHFEQAPADRPRAYPLSVLQDRLPGLDGEEERKERVDPGAPGGDGGIDAVSRLIADVRNGTCGWHVGMVRLVAIWVSRGWSNAEVLLACESLTMPGWTVAQTRAEVSVAIEGARRKGWDGGAGGDAWGGASATTDGYPAASASWARMVAHKPRNWIYGHHLIRGFVSLLAAPGGTGKSAYAICAALAIVTNASPKEMLKERVHTAGRVWICNLEDPLDELDKRLLAACLHYGFASTDIEDRLFLTSGRDQPLVVAAAQKDGSVMVSPVVDQVIEEIKRLGIDVLVVDPFIRSHRVLENANEQIDVVMALWARVAKEGNCAVWLVHHFRKGSGGNGGSADAFRGASALIDAARAALSLTVMSENEAARFGIEEEKRWAYVRLDNAKLNLAPPPEDAIWLRLVGVDLGNATKELPADNVQVVERWKPPSAWADLSMAMIVRILDKIDAGPEDGEFYTASARSNERWAGSVIMDDAGKTPSQAKQIVKAWLTSDPPVLEESEYNSPAQNWKTIKRVRVNNAQLQAMRRQSRSSEAPEEGAEE